ncbi:MAG: hypothetical protein Q9205_004237 [Flavoplaca limonia]
MLHGKKGFERIVWAFKNVLDNAVTWLFCDLEFKPDGSAANAQTIPLAKLHPVTKKCEPIRTVTGSIRVPESIEGCSAPRPPVALEDRVIEMDEWLNLVMLQSPRIQQNDHIDPYLCRYRPPDESSSEIRRLCLRHPLSSRPWFSLSCQAFQTGVVDRIDGYTVLALSGRVDGEQDNLAGSRESSLESRRRSARSYVLWEHSQA